MKVDEAKYVSDVIHQLIPEADVEVAGVGHPGSRDKEAMITLGGVYVEHNFGDQGGIRIRVSPKAMIVSVWLSNYENGLERMSASIEKSHSLEEHDEFPARGYIEEHLYVLICELVMEFADTVSAAADALGDLGGVLDEGIQEDVDLEAMQHQAIAREV